MVEYGFGLSSGHASVAVLLQDTFGHHREARDITVIEYVKAFVKAMQADKFGGPEQLKLVDAGEPEPATGQVRIRVRSAGVNPADLVRLSGLFPGVGLPYTPGTDVSGEIDAVGAGVNTSRIGERVYGRGVNPSGWR
jgi:hypothetical protein